MGVLEDGVEIRLIVSGADDTYPTLSCVLDGFWRRDRTYSPVLLTSIAKGAPAMRRMEALTMRGDWIHR
jgi:hypothetical protein